MENTGLVSVKGFGKKYSHTKNAVFACKNVDFEAASGEITGLLGLNGAGKSTLLKALCGIHLATEGSLCVCGESDADRIRKITGFVSELPDFDKSMLVKEALYFEAGCHGLDRKQALFQIEQAVSQTGIAGVMDKKIAGLSKGYMQRVSLACALCFDPKVLVLDEFSSGLDPEQIVKIRDTIINLSKNKIVILSTHHIEEALAMCRNIYIMYKGSITASGSAEQIISLTGRKNLEEAFLALTSQKTEAGQILSGSLSES